MDKFKINKFEKLTAELFYAMKKAENCPQEMRTYYQTEVRQLNEKIRELLEEK